MNKELIEEKYRITFSIKVNKDRILYGSLNAELQGHDSEQTAKLVAEWISLAPNVEVKIYKIITTREVL